MISVTVWLMELPTLPDSAECNHSYMMRMPFSYLYMSQTSTRANVDVENTVLLGTSTWKAHVSVNMNVDVESMSA